MFALFLHLSSSEQALKTKPICSLPKISTKTKSTSGTQLSLFKIYRDVIFQVNPHKQPLDAITQLYDPQSFNVA